MRPATGESEPSIEKLEERLDNFRISTDSDITIRGSAWQGYAVNIPACEQTPVTPGTGACCLPDDTCEEVTPGQCLLDGGTFIGGSCTPNPCGTPVTCPDCDDLPPTNPGGPPVHINIVRSISGTCGTGTATGSMSYDIDLSFSSEGPIGGHFFCAHNIFDTGLGGPWTGEFLCNGVVFFNQGFTGLLGRDVADCSWWLNLNPFLIPQTCGGCFFNVATIFEMIAGPGDPSGVYNFSETVSGFTLDTTVTIT